MKSLNQLREERPHHSYSSLNQYLNCSLAYAFKYVYRVEPEFVPANLAFGSAFHDTASYLLTQKKNGKIEKVETAQEIFASHWNASVNAKIRFDSDSANELKAKGLDMISEFWKNWNPDDSVIDIELTFCVPIPDGEGGYIETPLIGEFDIIIKDRFGETLIVDLKTAAKKWPENKADKELQATVFSYAWQFGNGNIPRFRYDIITKTKKPEYVQLFTERYPEDFIMLTKLVQTVERARIHGVFLPNCSSFFCEGCQFSKACKKWRSGEKFEVKVTKAA